METQKNKKGILVGIFVTIGLVIFVLGVFTLGGQQNAFVKTIEITAIFNDVDGLQQGNNISMSHVRNMMVVLRYARNSIASQFQKQKVCP